MLKSKGLQNRQRIIGVAQTLFHQKGFNQTSFSEIAEISGIPKGNFYYYFKSKDELLNEVIDTRLKALKGLMDKWVSEYQNPKDRLVSLLVFLEEKDEQALRHGCPVGSLLVELAKSHPELQLKALKLFEFGRGWLMQQFSEMGHAARAEELAMELMIQIQGAMVMAGSYDDKNILQSTHKRLLRWINEI